MWQHNYQPVGGNLGLSALVAAIPILVLFYMLGVRRKPTWVAASSALAAAWVVALTVYGMPVRYGAQVVPLSIDTIPVSVAK